MSCRHTLGRRALAAALGGRTRAGVTGLAALAILCVSAPGAASPPFLPTPLEVNQTAPCTQRDPEVVTLADGDLMVAWLGSVGDGFGIAGRRLRPEGIPAGPELALEIPDRLVRVGGLELAALPDGGFLLGWAIRESSSEPVRILLSRFDVAGESLGTIDVGAPAGAAIDRFALAVDGQGRAAVAWTDDSIVWLALFDADLTPVTGSRPVGQPDSPASVVGTVAVARTVDGWTTVVWDESEEGSDPPYFHRVRARTLDPDGVLEGGVYTVNDVAARSYQYDSLDPTIAAVSPTTFVVAWVTNLAFDVEDGVYGRELTFFGHPIGRSFPIHSELSFLFDAPSVAATEDGGYAVAWKIQPPYPPVDPLPPSLDIDPVIRTRWFGPGGVPAGDEFELWNRNDGRWQERPALAFSQGTLVQVWRDFFPLPPILSPPCLEEARILAMTTRLTCVPTGTRLCLQRGRFAVEAVLPLPGGAGESERRATAVPLTDDTGTFWFFRPDNVELMTKVLDGRALNNRFWFFSGALSDVDYTIRVTDTVLGLENDYPSGHELVSFADTATFFDFPPPPSSAPAQAVVDPPASLAAPTHPVTSCEGPQVLCLHGGTFRARIDWADLRTGRSGRGFAQNLSDESGYFWFFRRTNAEVLFKILDGRPVNGYHWAFVGGLTDVEYTLTVESSLFPPSSWTYHKPAGVLESAADTRALVDCPNCLAFGASAAEKRHVPVRSGNGLP